MKEIGVECRKLEDDELGLIPDCFEKENVKLLRHLNWCILYQKNSSPHYYMRNMEPDYYRWGGIIKLGDHPLDFQTSRHHEDIAQLDTPTTNYKKISENPLCYEMKSDVPMTEFKYMKGKALWKEGEILDVEAEFFPRAIIIHPGSPQRICYWAQPVLIKGMYEGKPIRTLGCIDRFFAPQNKNLQKKALEDVLKHYIWSYYFAIRKDGKKEVAYFNICERNGKGVVVYWLEGQQPIISDEVLLEAEWHRLPYAPENDTSVIFTKAVWKFCGREVHFKGKWGAKGHTATPRMNPIGLTHCYGSWYEGKLPREYELMHAANECSGATIETIEKMGFIVNQ